MAVSRSRPITRFRVHVRIPRRVQVEGGRGARSASPAGVAFEVVGLTLQGPGAGEGWFDLELQGCIEAHGPLPEGLALILGTVRCEGLLASDGGLALPVVFASDGEAAAASLAPSVHGQQAQCTRVRVCIPSRFQHEPVLSTLVAKHGLIVNILGALLGSDGCHDGWFDLEVRGSAEKTAAGLAYLEDLGLQVWPGQTGEDDW